MKMTTFREFQTKWDTMPERRNSYLSVGNIDKLNFQIGYGSNGLKSLVIINSGILKEIPSSFAIKVENPQLDDGNKALVFQLIQSSLGEEFQRLCWDMIGAAVTAQNPLNGLIKRYKSWQKLLQYYQNSTMSFERQKGLLGELLYFQEVLKTHGSAYALHTWCGPDGSDQDFLFETSWAEIKTTALASDNVKISSLEQLKQEQDGLMIVYVLERSTPGENRICLSDVVAEIRDFIIEDIVGTDSFEMKLFKYGYRTKDEDEYRKHYFRLIEKREYLVDERFPKLTRDNVPAQVLTCKYDLSLPALDMYRRK